MSFHQRLTFLALCALVGMIAMVVRLYGLQISDHAHWEAMLLHRSHMQRTIPGPRGRIVDATGSVLAADGPGFDLMVRTAAWNGALHRCDVCAYELYLLPGQRKNYRRCPRCKKETAKHLHSLRGRRNLRPLARLLNTTAPKLRARLDKLVVKNAKRVAKEMKGREDELGARRFAAMSVQLRREYGWQSVVFQRDVSYEVAREITLHPARNPAFRIRESRTRRNYGGSAFAHLIGSEPDAAVRARNLSKGQPSGTGRGLERTYHQELCGESGNVQTGPDRDRPGYLKVLRSSRPVAGLDVRLTLTRADQQSALDALGRNVGAFVVVNAETGAVLAMVSTPTFDPDRYREVVTRMVRMENRARKEKRPLPVASPLLARAVQGIYPPGSTFKPFTGVAGLRGGVVDLGSTIDCNKFYVLDGRTMHKSMKCMGTHGPIEMRSALVQSCNIYFQTIVDRLMSAGKEEEFLTTAHLFGFGEPTGLENEPSSMVRKRTFRIRPAKRRVPKGARIQAGIGQGLVTVTPAQVARAYAALATGYLPKLHVVASVGNRDEALERTKLPVPPEQLEAIRRALRAKTAADSSLQYDAYKLYRVGTKTGTAQRYDSTNYTAWLAGFAAAQANRPAIAFAMVVEDSPDYGGITCGPLVARFLSDFYAGGSVAEIAR